MESLSVATGVWVALALTALLAALHLLAPRVQHLPGVPERAVASFAGGLSVSYVFLHLLPDIATGNEAIGEALDDVLEITPLVDLGIFLVALVGFTAFYGLERLARPHRREGSEAPPGLFRLHLGAFAVYNALITYTMPLRARTGVGFALLFTVAMGLHFVLTDRGLREAYPRRFRHTGRYLLVAGLVLGWVLGALLAPTNTLVVSLLTALLAGSILLNVFKEELPEDRDSSFGWFAVGLASYAALLLVLTELEQ